MGEGLSVADAMALQNRNNDGFFGGGGSWIFFLFFLLAWGGNGTFGGNRNGADDVITMSKLDGISNGLCDGFYAQNTTMLQNFGQISSAIQNCCCETNRNIDSVRYDNAQNTQKVLDKLCSMETDRLRADLQSAQAQIARIAMKDDIISSVRPFPVPAYMTCSPYTSSYGGGYGGCGFCG